jgi:hypothetical protein
MRPRICQVYRRSQLRCQEHSGCVVTTESDRHNLGAATYLEHGQIPREVFQILYLFVTIVRYIAIRTPLKVLEELVGVCHEASSSPNYRLSVVHMRWPPSSDCSISSSPAQLQLKNSYTKLTELGRQHRELRKRIANKRINPAHYPTIFPYPHTALTDVQARVEVGLEHKPVS